MKAHCFKYICLFSQGNSLCGIIWKKGIHNMNTFKVSFLNISKVSSLNVISICDFDLSVWDCPVCHTLTNTLCIAILFNLHQSNNIGVNLFYDINCNGKKCIISLLDIGFAFLMNVHLWSMPILQLNMTYFYVFFLLICKGSLHILVIVNFVSNSLIHRMPS